MQLLSMRQVAQRLSVSRSAVYVLLKAPEFPRPLEIGGRRCFLEAEINAWIESRAEARGA